MHWAQPQMLVFVAVFVVSLALLMTLALRRKRQLLQKFTSRRMLPVLAPDFLPGRQILRAVLLIAGIALVTLSLCRPQWGFRWEEVKRKGVDILVAVDVSKSMLARDVEPSRLQRARREMIDLIRMLKGDRMGLIAFAGVPYLQCPLTLDYGALEMFLDYLNPDLIPVPGTAIAEAIDLATQIFQKQATSKEKALILITDGEDHGGDVLKAAAQAKQAGVRIFAIGIGQESGAPIPAEEGGGFEKDDGGNVIVSKLDEETLKKIALETGGVYVRATSNTDIDLQRIYTQEIRSNMEQVELRSGKQRKWEERFQWPLALGILLILLEPFVAETRLRRLLPGRAAGMALLAAVVTASTAHAGRGERLYNKGDFKGALESLTQEQIKTGKRDAALNYNVGNTHYRLGNFDEAAKSFAEAASSPDKGLSEKALYNLGNTAYYQGKLEQAVAAYEQALKLNPKDEDAQHNLAFVKEEMKRRQQQRQQQNQQQNQQQQQKSDSQEKSEAKSENSPQTPKLDQGQPPQDQKSETAGQAKTSPEQQDAQRILENLSEDRAKFDKKRLMEQAARGHKARNGKDW